MSKKNIAIPLILGIGAIVIIANLAGKPTQAAETLGISTVYNACDPNTLPLMVALQNGYFTRQNINVNLLGATDVENPPPGDVDVLVTGRGLFYLSEDEYPGIFKAFNFNLQDESKWNDAVIVSKDSGITTLSQLKGRTIGLGVGGDIPTAARVAALKVMLEKNDVNPAEVGIVSSPAPNELTFNGVDAWYLREPQLSLALHSGQHKILEAGPIFARYIFSPWPMSVSALSSQLIQQKPETAKKVVSAWDNAISFIRDNPTQADNMLTTCVKENYGQDGIQVRQINHWKSSETDKNLVQEQLQWYHSIGVTTKELNVNDILY